MPDTPETVLKPPIGYSKLPDGVRCRCIKLWQDAKGAFYCCRSGTPSSATPEVSELVERLRDDPCQRDGWPDDLEMEAATALETYEARVKVLEEALQPFAAMAEWIDNTNERRDAIYCGGIPGLRCEVTKADYHRARAALNTDTPDIREG